ncbi:MAG: hypothetical protein KF822_00245 [Steroidobacteraceae bacterium]|nr:hypothetical protein [Steroidobacteraceae bacterium]
MYESRHQPLLHRAGFVRRVLGHATAVLGLVLASIAIGMAGYVAFERLSWTDAFVETAMLLGGMGPIHAPQTEAGKLFAGLFALYAGLVFIVAAALLLGPVVHRLLHHFHLERSRRDG